MINYNYYDITNVPMGELLDWLSDFKEINIRYSTIDNRYCNLSAYYDNNSVIDNSYSSYLVTVEGSLFDEKVLLCYALFLQINSLYYKVSLII